MAGTCMRCKKKVENALGQVICNSCYPTVFGLPPLTGPSVVKTDKKKKPKIPKSDSSIKKKPKKKKTPEKKTSSIKKTKKKIKPSN